MGTMRGFALLSAALVIAGLADRPARAEDRSINGTGNNVDHPDWGAAGTPLMRKTDPVYMDGMGEPMMPPDRNGAREISNLVFAQSGLVPNTLGLSDFVWQWGQFIDHDLTLVLQTDEPMDIPVPTGDPAFDPAFSGLVSLHFTRSEVVPGTGVPGVPRQQANVLTAYIDGSQVYGSDDARAAGLRAHVGGLLATSPGNLLPFNTSGLPNFPDPSPGLFVAGDVRANEQISLTTMHTLFVREHNRLAQRIVDVKGWDPAADDDRIYQLARKIVGAEMQIITYTGFLPALLGPMAPSPADFDYNKDLQGAIFNEFATGLYRVGHTMLSPNLQRIDADGTVMPPFGLRDVFFHPELLIDDPDNIDRILRGLASQKMQNIDSLVVEDVRSFLFGPPGAGGLDLPAMNLQRGRDHGLTDYNGMRVAYGLDPVSEFDQISSDPAVQSRLIAACEGDINNLDPWTGAISEDHLPGAAVGELLATALADQFTRLRDGDRFFYAVDPGLDPGDLAGIIDLGDVNLARIVMDNTSIMGLQADVFHVVPEPATAALAATGGLLLLGRVFRRRRSRQAVG